MASKVFNNLDALYKYLENDIVFSLGMVAEDIKKILRDYIEENVYKAYSPYEYDRTYELLNCLDISPIKKIGDIYSFSIFFNTDKIGMYNTDDRWNQHKSVFGYETWHGMPINELIPWFIENGTENSVWDRKGIYSIEYVKERLEKTDEHLKMIKKILKSKGYNVEIV
jgi:hypothetical protein